MCLYKTNKLIVFQQINFWIKIKLFRGFCSYEIHSKLVELLGFLYFEYNVHILYSLIQIEIKSIMYQLTNFKDFCQSWEDPTRII
jgi:hypothetical protein